MSILISEPPLQVLPSLAKEIGLNEALVLQQLHYRLIKSKSFYEGRFWVCQTYEQWNKQFPFWSIRTLKSIFQSLLEQGFVVSRNLNEDRLIQTRWYSIEYEKVAAITPPLSHPKPYQIIHPTKEEEQFALLPLPSSKAVSRAELETSFQTFWTSYPAVKRKIKDEAKKIWMKIRPDKELFGIIMNALEKWKEDPQWNKSGGEFIPLPYRWLKRKQWEDEFHYQKDKSNEDVLSQWLETKEDGDGDS